MYAAKAAGKRTWHLASTAARTTPAPALTAADRPIGLLADRWPVYCTQNHSTTVWPPAARAASRKPSSPAVSGRQVAGRQRAVIDGMEACLFIGAGRASAELCRIGCMDRARPVACAATVPWTAGLPIWFVAIRRRQAGADLACCVVRGSAPPG